MTSSTARSAAIGGDGVEAAAERLAEDVDVRHDVLVVAGEGAARARGPLWISSATMRAPASSQIALTSRR